MTSLVVIAKVATQETKKVFAFQLPNVLAQKVGNLKNLSL
jgi:hypothetical protein